MEDTIVTASDGSGYGKHGASGQKRSMLGWMTALSSPVDDIERNIESLRERSRDLYMGAPIASGAFKTMVTNVVGIGLKLNSQIDYEFLGMTLEEADALETVIEREFNYWAESENCDASRMCDFDELQSLAFLSMLMSGDCFTLLPMKKRAGAIYQTTVKLIEADRVCNPNFNDFMNENLINGVETDASGEVIAYHIADKHPNSSLTVQNNWRRVEKYGKKTGRVNVIHLLELERPEQRRGVPLLSPVIESLKQIDRYTDAELMAAVINGMYSLFIKTEASQQGEFGGGFGDAYDEDEDDSKINIGNGSVNFLREGESIQESNPGRPNANFDGFVTAIFRQIGVALELPYEVLMKHFTSSYSASRGALLEAWKMFKRRRSWLAKKFCQPIYNEWFAEAVALGRINAPGFFNDPLIRKAYTRAEWLGPTQGQLDPKKEVEAAILRVENGFSTRTKETQELTGGNYFANHALRVQEEKLRSEAGFGVVPKVVPVEETTKENEDDNDEEDDADDK